MSHRIVAVDVHKKKMLAVVVTDVAGEASISLIAASSVLPQ
ncbi:MAG: hypothetical protein ABSH56_07355 [Bryobacteraceae bacterium]